MDILECICLKILTRTEGDNPRSTLLVESEGTQFILNLWNPWEDVGDYIIPYTKIRILNVEKVDTGDSTFIQLVLNLSLLLIQMC